MWEQGGKIKDLSISRDPLEKIFPWNGLFFSKFFLFRKQKYFTKTVVRKVSTYIAWFFLPLWSALSLVVVTFHLLFSYAAFSPPCFDRIFQLYCIYILHEWIMSITFLFYILIRFVVAFLTVALFFPLWWSAGATWFLHPFAISLKPIIFNMTTLIFTMLLSSPQYYFWKQ